MSTPEGKDPSLRVRQEEPLNAGPPLSALRADEVTGNDLFFVRNHGNVPALDPATYRLEIGGLVENPLSLTLAELRALPPVRRMATLECAGNRRSELIAWKPIPGELPWHEEAISNAFWTGASLAELLERARPRPAARHVAFTGLDQVERHGKRFGFGGSVPLDKALAPETILAYEMNGAPLPALHGAPLRALVPGYIGARSVKWLSRITLQEKPSDNYFQAVAYRLFPPEVTAETVDWESGTMLGDVALSAVICSPEEGETVRPGVVRVKGYAIAGAAGGSGEGRRVARVEVSGDGGTSWVPADLHDDRGPWVWRFWRVSLGLVPGDYEIMVRAWDDAGNGQPETVASVWNFKGYMNNAWHRVRVRCRE
ncbi:MAG TPA: sulfite oxidase [Thermoanaerobaculia bacterium]|nr:sulfite oxidase [Thermoanaerobaculia bacterium]